MVSILNSVFKRFQICGSVFSNELVAPAFIIPMMDANTEGTMNIDITRLTHAFDYYKQDLFIHSAQKLHLFSGFSDCEVISGSAETTCFKFHLNSSQFLQMTYGVLETNLLPLGVNFYFRFRGAVLGLDYFPGLLYIHDNLFQYFFIFEESG
jgi:hypothetical protein